MELNFTKIDPPEPKRIYRFPDRDIAIENVVAVCVRPSGTHRLETADGRKYIVNAGWLVIELVGVEKWTF